MSDTNILRRMLHKSAVIALENSHQNKKKVRLVESSCPTSFVVIENIPYDTIIINLDDSFKNSDLFASSQGECKRADYILISESVKKVLFIEMKNTKIKDGWGGITKQLKGSKCVFEYLQVIAREFFEQQNFLSQYQSHFVGMRHTSIPKRRTKQSRGSNKETRGKTPENFLMISGSKTIQFNMLFG